MNDELLNFLSAVCGDFKQLVYEAVRNVYYAHHSDKTGKLGQSIRADAGYELRGNVAVVHWVAKAGGSAAGAYYGWFLEYGTGRFAENPLVALAGYPGFPFNPLRPPAGSGWDIVGRPGTPREGILISHGIHASHWFSRAASAAKAITDAYAAQLNDRLRKLNAVNQAVASRLAMLTTFTNATANAMRTA